MDKKKPDWAGRRDLIRAQDIPEADYPYPVQWVNDHSAPAQDYVLSKYAKHNVVVLGEFHNVREHKEFVINLIPRLYKEAGVRIIAWEFSRRADNARLERLVTVAKYDPEAALNFARDQVAHEWNSREHWDIIQAVWRLNKSLKPDQEKLRFTGLHGEYDWPNIFCSLQTRPKDSPEYHEALRQVRTVDGIMAQEVEKQIIQPGKKGLVFVGRCHDFTHHEFLPTVNFGRDIMARLLYKKYGERVFQVWEGGCDFLPLLEKTIMRLAGDKQVGFDLYDSPFANILTDEGWSDASAVPIGSVARGYVYFGPASSLHRNTPIEGFVTDEMFSRYKRHYEVDFGHKFDNAQELDSYLQAHRFKYNAPKD